MTEKKKMATAPFSSSVLSSKLRDLQNTMHSIQTLSLWITQHKRHAKHVAEIWIKEFQRGEAASLCTVRRSSVRVIIELPFVEPVVLLFLLSIINFGCALTLHSL